MKQKRNTPIKSWQRKLWIMYTLVYRVCFGLNHVGDYPANHRDTITIGEGCVISSTVQFIPQQHKKSNPKLFEREKPIIIGDCCWIGANVVIMPGVVLGDHTVVGANAVVTHSFPEGYCVIVGVPAKKVGKI